MIFRSFQFDPVNFVELFYPALYLFCFCGFGTKTLDKTFGLADLSLLVIICGTLNGEALFLFSQVFGVVAFIDVQVAEAEFPGGSRHVVQERPVMGNDDQAAGEGDKKLLEPAKGGDIKMVCRLIEKEKGRSGKKLFG